MDFKQLDDERTVNCELRDSLSELTNAQREALIISTLGHIQEEIVEFRQHWPRRSWRNDEVSPFDSDKKYDDALTEFADIILLLGNVAKYAKYDAEIVTDAIQKKLKYNQERSDHKANLQRPGD